MTGQEAFVEELVQQLREHGIAFMIAGSLASSFHGEPRATRDVDLVIDCTGDQLGGFLHSITERGWYANSEAALAAHKAREMFNVIDPSSGWKADLISLKARDFSACEFQRRSTAKIFGPESITVALSTPEDTILSKLEWSGKAHSEQQYRDALAVAVVAGPGLDRDYLRHWADELGIRESLEQLLAEADERGTSGR